MNNKKNKKESNQFIFYREITEQQSKLNLFKEMVGNIDQN